MSRELERMRKQSAAKIEAAKDALHERETVDRHLAQVQNEYSRVVDISRRAPAIIEDVDKKFKEKTKLSERHCFSFPMHSSPMRPSILVDK